MPMSELVDYIRGATEVFRHGDVYTIDRVGGVEVTTIDAFPPVPEAREVIDVHFFSVGFTEVTPTWTHRQLYDYLVDHQVGEFNTMSQTAWEAGQSYITIGGWIGSQELALRLLALGQVHQLWKVITPAIFHLTGQEADVAAGNGMVMNGGLKEPEVVPA